MKDYFEFLLFALNFFSQFFLIFTPLMLLVLFVGSKLEQKSCLVTWENSGYHAKYSVFAGCRVSRDGIIFIPSFAVREIGEE